MGKDFRVFREKVCKERDVMPEITLSEPKNRLRSRE